MANQELKPWKTLSRKVLLDHGKFLTVENHQIQLPSGEVIEDWPWVITPDAVIVLAKTVEERYLCFRQTKYAVQGLTLAPVGGMIGPNENPLPAAKRELLEETGYKSNEWVELGSYAAEPNRGVGKVNLFLALNSEKISAPESDDLEVQELIKMTHGELVSALIAGEFKVLHWTACVSMALIYEKQHKPN